MELIEITQHGEPAKTIGDLPGAAQEVLHSTAELYARNGYSPPWIGYLAVENGNCVGACAFKASPVDDRVEIAYSTFPGHEGRGVATNMTRRLVEMAFQAAPTLTIAAQTLPEDDAYTAVLKKCDFELIGEAENPEDGKVWEWQLVRN